MELRQRWYTSQAKPRTYAAQGGKVYSRSQYLQDPFTDLVNSLPMCHHKTRLRPARLRLKTGQWLRVYDLEAFTSRMHEQKNLLSEMSLFVKGWPFTYYDAWEGLVTRDFGEMLWEYNQECNFHVETSYERVSAAYNGFTGRHCYASLLGIFGNLMSCTLGHTLVMDQIFGDDDCLNVAGDDGAVPEDKTTTQMMDSCIAAVGLDEPSKRFRSDEAGCICLKRPLYQFGTVLEQGFLIIPPTIVKLANLLYDYDDSRYRFIDEGLSTTEKYSIAGKEVMRFLRSTFRAEGILSTQEKRDVLNYAKAISELYQVPNSIGMLPFCGIGAYFWPAFVDDPSWDAHVEEYFTLDPLFRTIDNTFAGSAEIPMLDDGNMREVELSRVQYAGMRFRSVGTKHLKFLRQLGILESEVVTERVEGLEAIDRLKHVLEEDSGIVYEYLVLEDIPIHLI